MAGDYQMSLMEPTPLNFPPDPEFEKFPHSSELEKNQISAQFRVKKKFKFPPKSEVEKSKLLT